MKKWTLFLFILILLTGCSRAKDQPEVRNKPAGLTIAQIRSALGMGAMLRRSGAPLAALGGVGFVPAAWASGRPQGEQPSLAPSTRRQPGVFLDETSPSPTLGIIAIGGHVINASGGIPPQNAFMDLNIFENGEVVSQIKIPLDQTGIFRFDMVPWNPTFSYQVATTFNDLRFTSGLIDGRILQPGTIVDVPVIVYDSSTDTQFLRAMRMKVMVDFSTPGWAVVSENILISNPTSLVIVPAGDTVPVLDYGLPKGAVNVTFPDGSPANRYRLTRDGFGDWQPILPGDGHQVMVQYSIPFTSTWHCDFKTPIPLDSLMVVVKASGIETSGTGMDLNLVQSDQETAISVYTASDIHSDESYALIFSTRDHIQKIWLGIGFFAATLIFALIWVIRAKRQKDNVLGHPVFAETIETEDTILDAIIALDDRYKHGDITSEAYLHTRSELVEKLEALKNQTKG